MSSIWKIHDMKTPSKKAIESHFGSTKPGMVCVKLEGEKVQSKDPKSFWLTFKIDDNGVDLKDYVRYDNEKVQKLWKKIEKDCRENFQSILILSWRVGEAIEKIQKLCEGFVRELQKASLNHDITRTTRIQEL